MQKQTHKMDCNCCLGGWRLADLENDARAQTHLLAEYDQAGTGFAGAVYGVRERSIDTYFRLNIVNRIQRVGAIATEYGDGSQKLFTIRLLRPLIMVVI